MLFFFTFVQCRPWLLVANDEVIPVCLAVIELTEEEKEQFLSSEEFLSLFSHSTKLMERALTEDKGIFMDYRGKGDEDGDG